ncbi:HPP family protein [Flavobacterium sp. W1B]|uniref:HPP family protein n=1 Tax=Flavobacterium sp. W1B TaxID=3394146 RepID=UPI0039BD3941
MDKISFKVFWGYAIIILMVVASLIFKDKEIILPEMAALAIGCLIYQNPVWLSKPLHIFLLPSITAILGFLINKLDISLTEKLILVLPLMLVVLRLFKSHLAPALATGLLPIITNCSSFAFILSILVLSFLLSISLKFIDTSKNENLQPRLQQPKDSVIYVVFISIWIIICSQIGWMFMAAIPPVIVVGYESVHKESYHFSMLRKQVICLFLAAFVGTQTFYFVDNLVIVALIDIVAVTFILKLFKFKLPPAYAMAILPMALHKLSYNYFYWQVLIMSISVFGIVYIYKNANEYITNKVRP